jgi:23S rRNA (adenine-N6)-dimethyltransferase
MSNAQSGDGNPRSTDPRKALSQNFLRGGKVVAEFVARATIKEGDHVVEIGGGDGAITRELATTKATVTVIERDPRYADRLRQRFSESPTISVIQVDVRDFTWPQSSFHAMGNLPFSVTTDILRILFERAGEGLQRADLIMQADVARKRAGSPEGNKLNLVWAPWWHLSIGQTIGANSFSPRPRVDGAVLVAKRRVDPLLPPEAQPLWTGLIETAFQRGGEPLRRSLNGTLTSTQLRRASAGRWDPTAVTSRTPLSAWIDIYKAVRDHVPRERWPETTAPTKPPRAGGKVRPARSAYRRSRGNR